MTTLDILGTIDDRYNSFDGILGTGGDRTIQCKVLSAAADRMSFDRPSPSAEDLASDIEESEDDTETALLDLQCGGYVVGACYFGWKLTDRGYEAAKKIDVTACYYISIDDDGGRDWKFDDCTVKMIPIDRDLWGFRVTAPTGRSCDVTPADVDDAIECYSRLENGESPVSDGWEDGSGHEVYDLLIEEEEA